MNGGASVGDGVGEAVGCPVAVGVAVTPAVGLGVGSTLVGATVELAPGVAELGPEGEAAGDPHPVTTRITMASARR
jgi:hypothetical protein